MAMTTPGFADPPSIILSTAMLSHLNPLHTSVSESNSIDIAGFDGPFVEESLPFPFNDDDAINGSIYSPRKKKNRRWP